MVATVITDEATIFVVRRKESAAIFCRLQRGCAVCAWSNHKRGKELLLAVHLEGARVLLFVSDVRSRAGSNQYGSRRQIHIPARSTEPHRTNMVELIDDGFFRIEILDERYSFLERFDDLFMIQTVSRRIDHAFAIHE